MLNALNTNQHSPILCKKDLNEGIKSSNTSEIRLDIVRIDKIENAGYIVNKLHTGQSLNKKKLSIVEMVKLVNRKH